jgi:UDP-glucose 4-epimerase
MRPIILVTGGMGYIGSHTIIELHNSGYETVIVDNLSNSNIDILDKIKLIIGKDIKFINLDLQDSTAVDDCLSTLQNVSGVIHFAALKAVGESVEFPLKYYKNNIFSLVNLLQSMQKYNIGNLVFSSSCTVYGQPIDYMVSEQSEIKQPASPYGNTKKICEEIIKDTTQSTNLNAVSLRYFNPAGAHDSGLIGELPLNTPNNLVPFLMQAAIGKRSKLMIFGKDYPTPDGTAIRDYIHVVDIAKAHIKALNRLISKEARIAHEIFNLGSGKSYSVLEVIDCFENATSIKLNYEFTNRRLGDIIKICADTSLSKKNLKWEADRSLQNILLTAWAWEQNLSNGY